MSEVQVLVVEDEPLICELISTALEDEGLEIACAGDPDAAVVALEQHAATLRVLLTDINLKARLTGFDVAREARRRLPEIVVIYVTGHAEAEISGEGVQGGMVVPKPYRVDELAARVAALARGARRG